jgi:hypothetical protein
MQELISNALRAIGFGVPDCRSPSKNNSFTEALAQEIRKSREKVAAVFPNVQMQVHASTQSEQLPGLSVSSLGKVCLNTTGTGFDVWKKVSLNNNQAEFEALIMERQQRSKCDRDSTQVR